MSAATTLVPTVVQVKTTPAKSIERPDLPPLSAEMYAALKSDIAANGIRSEILVTADGHTIDGHIRLRIAKELGIPPKSIRKTVVGNLSPEERTEWRVIINTLRSHLSRKEVRDLVDRYLRQHPETSNRKVAAITGSDHTTVGKRRKALEQSGDILKLDVRTCKDGRSYPAVRKPVIATANEHQFKRVTTQLGKLRESAPTGNQTLRSVNRAVYQSERLEQIANLPDVTLDANFDFRNCDFRNSGIECNSVNLVVADPPWSEIDQAEDFAKEAYRILKPNGNLVIYTGVFYLPQWLDIMIKAGFVYEWQFVVVFNTPGALRQKGAIMCRHVPVLLLRKQPEAGIQTNPTLADVLESPALEKAFHPWQQALGPVSKLVESLSGPGDVVADLTVGSGTTAVAVALAGEGRRFIGCEIEPDYVRAAKARVAEALATDKE
jgi:SAM-dependent methyltransferase